MAGLSGDPLESKEHPTIDARNVEAIPAASDNEPLLTVLSDPHCTFLLARMQQADSEGQHRGAVKA